MTPERWGDLVRLFGERGAYGGCWCMWWRVSSSEFRAETGAGNREAMRSTVESGRVPGLLAYLDGEPAGWISVGPRADFPRLERSPLTRELEGGEPWSVVCFYVDRRHRLRGVAAALLDAAVRYALEHGAEAVEGYPYDPEAASTRPPEAWTGVPSLFLQAGFREVARPRPGRPVMWLDL